MRTEPTTSESGPAVATSCRLQLLPDGESREVAAGVTLLEAVAAFGVELTAPCGGEGTCGKCRVVVSEGGEGEILPEERAMLSAEQLAEGYRLACRARLRGPLSLSVPPASRATQIRVLPAGVRRRITLEPAVVKQAVRLTPQTLSEPHARLEQLRRCGDLRADLRAKVALLRRLPELLEVEEETVVTAVMRGAELLDIEKGDTAARCFGLALDLGTTTVVAALVDLVSGKTVGHGVSANTQATHGHDVIARINMTQEEANGLAVLREAAADSLRQAISQVLDREQVAGEEVYEACLVGNATMMHLCLGIPPASLGRLPYAAVVGDEVEVGSADLALKMHPSAPIHVLPNIAGYVGADTVAAILAAGLDEDDGRIRVLADIGTNCELALRCGDRLLVASTPAGPAFEGARISCGMYAVAGAVEAVEIGWPGEGGERPPRESKTPSGDGARRASEDGEVRCKVIGGGEALGLCGSGLVDVAAELVRTGLVDETGRMLGPEELDSKVPDALVARIEKIDDKWTFALARGEAGGVVALTQRDVRELQLAKAAIRSGIDLLLEAGGVGPEQVDEFCIAGGFGNYLNRGNAIRLGLIPPLPAERVRYIGNGALMGATLALLSRDLRRRGAVVARQAEHLQIAGTPDFQTRFADAMMFETVA